MSFPGRSFKISNVLPYNKKTIKRILGNTKANITVRNFPESVNSLRKKFNINDGGNTYAFFTININNEKIVIICEKA